MKTVRSVVQYISVGTVVLGILAGCSKKVEVPAVIGLNLEAARAKFAAAGLVDLEII